MFDIGIHFIDLYFSIKLDDSQIIYACFELIFFSSIIIFIITSVIRKNRARITFISFSYLVLGLLIFCYLLIKQLKTSVEGPSQIARPIEYYKYKMNILIYILIISTCGFRMAASALMFLLANNIKRLDEYVSEQLVDKEDKTENNSKGHAVINYANHSSNSIEKVTDSLEKKGLVLNSEGSSSGEGNLVKKESMDNYYKKILKET